MGAGPYNPITGNGTVLSEQDRLELRRVRTQRPYRSELGVTRDRGMRP